MTLCVVELNDSEIRVGNESGLLVRSPGRAVVHDQDIRLGHEASRQARLHPHRTYDRFWSHLNQDSLPTSTPRFRHNADLAYAHLLDLHARAGQPRKLVFAVPGSYSRQQLALLLGIAGACPFSVVGLVDSAVAHVAAVAPPGRYLVVETGLHHTLLTAVDVDQQAVRRWVRTVEVGLAGMYDIVAESMADTFIRHSRFDPYHHAETEQALYDQIPHCLDTLDRHPEVLLEIQFRGARHQVHLSREALLDRLRPCYTKIRQHLEPDRIVLIGDRIAALPGFTAILPAGGQLEPEGVVRGCLAHLEEMQTAGPGLRLVTRLPATAEPAVILRSAGEALQPAAEPPTHLLFGHRALPLETHPVYLSGEGVPSPIRQESSACAIARQNGQVVIEPLGRVPIRLNGARLSQPQPLAAGDEIGFTGSDTNVLLIRVLSDGT